MWCCLLLAGLEDSFLDGFLVPKCSQRMVDSHEQDRESELEGRRVEDSLEQRQAPKRGHDGEGDEEEHRLHGGGVVVCGGALWYLRVCGRRKCGGRRKSVAEEKLATSEVVCDRATVSQDM